MKTKTKEKTVSELASLGGKARWKGISKEDRSKIMKDVVRGRKGKKSG